MSPFCPCLVYARIVLVVYLVYIVVNQPIMRISECARWVGTLSFHHHFTLHLHLNQINVR